MSTAARGGGAARCLVVQIGFGDSIGARQALCSTSRAAVDCSLPRGDAVLKATAEAYHANAVVFSFFRDGCCFVLLIAAALIEKGCRFRLRPRAGVFCGLGDGHGEPALLHPRAVLHLGDHRLLLAAAILVFAAFIAIVLGVEFPPLSKLRGWFKLFGTFAAGAHRADARQAAGSASEMKKATLGNIFLLLNRSCMDVNIQKVFIFNDKWQRRRALEALPRPRHRLSYFFGAIAMIISAVVGFYGEFTFGFGDQQRRWGGVPDQQLPRAEADAHRAGLRRAHLLGAYSPPPQALWYLSSTTF